MFNWNIMFPQSTIHQMQECARQKRYELVRRVTNTAKVVEQNGVCILYHIQIFYLIKRF